MENLIKREIVRFSKLRKDEDIFNDYILEKFRRFVSSPDHNDMVAYAAAITEVNVPVLFTGDSHMMHRA